MNISHLSCKRLAPALALAFIIGPHGHAHVFKDGGFVVYPASESGPGPVVFSHRSHGESSAGFACGQCHAPGPEKSLHITMGDIRHGQACGSCHNGRTQGPRSRQAAPPVEDCTSCHMPASDIVFKLNRMDPVRFSHVKHLSAELGKKVSNPTGFSCIDCHPTPFDRASKGSFGMQAPHDSGACAQCHNGRKRRDGMPPAFAATTRCLTCHRSPAIPSSNMPTESRPSKHS